MACASDRIGDDRNAHLFRDLRTYHVGLDDVASVAAEEGVGELVLTHLFPAVPRAQAETVFAAPIAETFDGPILVADDGDQITLLVD